MDRSIIAATEEAIEIRINVLSPAECRLLERSHPMSAARATAKNIRNSMEYTLMYDDQLPKYEAIGSSIKELPIIMKSSPET